MNETRSMIAKFLSRGSTDLADDSALGETPGWDSFEIRPRLRGRLCF
jgi:hypothetical protein